jgi:hypothetical protein
MKSAKDFKRELFIESVRNWEIFARRHWEKFSHFLKRVSARASAADTFIFAPGYLSPKPY